MRELGASTRSATRNLSRRVLVLCSWVWKHDAVKAALFYAVILAIMYPTVVFFGYTLQPATYASYGVTDNGVYQYDGRQPIYTFNIDMASSAYYEPGINKLVGEMYRGGELPLWNPYQAGGTPLASQFSTRVFFPYQILEDMSPTWTWDFFFLGRMWVAGLFTYLFLRALKLRKSSAILGGLFYMLSGAMVWYIHKEEYVNVAMTVPVFLWSIERLVSVQRPSDFLIATASTALVLLSGNPEIAAYVLLLGGTYAIYRIITDYGFGWSAARTAAKIAGAGVLGAGLAAPLLIPFAELSSNAFHMHPAGGTMGTVDPAPLSWGLGVIFPTFFDTPTPQRWYPINGVWEFIGGYIGVLAVFLAVMGLLRKSPHRGLIVFFFVFGICVVLKNIGVPPFLWIGRLPLLDQVWSNRWAGPAWTFSLAIAGALGFEILQQRWGESSQKWSWRRYWGVFLGAGGLAGVLIAVVFLKPVWNAYQAMIPERHYLMVPYSRDYMEASLIGAVLSAMVVLLTAVLLWRAAVSKRYLKLGMVALAVTALWFYIPRGYDYHFLYLKLIPMLGGIAAVWMLARARWRWAIATMVIMVILATGLDLGSPHGFPKRQDPFRAAPYVNYLREHAGLSRVMATDGVLMPNTSSALGLHDVRYITSVTVEPYHVFMSHLRGLDPAPWGDRPPDASDLWFTGLAPVSTRGGAFASVEFEYPVLPAIVQRLPYYSVLGVEYIAVPSGDSMPGLSNVYQDEVSIYKNPYALPRSFVAHRFEYAESFEAAQQRIGEPDFNWGNTVVLEEEIACPCTSESADELLPATIIDYEANRVVIEVDTPEPGMLVLSDTYFPGWKVKVDGNGQKIYRVNGVMRGVSVESGKHTVVFDYFPDSFRQGLSIAGLSLMASIAIFLITRRKARRKPFLGDPPPVDDWQWWK